MINPKNLCMGCMNEKVPGEICAACGYNPEESDSPNALAAGTVLNQKYLVGKVIECNGEGFTYIGIDLTTETVLRIREFFPAGLCERSLNNEVKVLQGNELSFNKAIINFLQMLKTLYKLRTLPALLPIIDIIEVNGTAYGISEASQSITLREFLLRNGGTLTWDQARPLFIPLISSIKELHEAGIIHRGLSPETLLVGKDGKMRIVGFCTMEARTARQSLTAQLFPGFAAIEQYGTVGKQGTWTDVYSFAAVLYRTLVGSPPPEATFRLENDDLSIPAKVAEELPDNIIDTLCFALQLLPTDRIENEMSTMEELRAALVATKEPPKINIQRPKKTVAPVKKEAPKHINNDKKKKKKNSILITIIICLTVLCLAVCGTVIYLNNSKNSDEEEKNNSSVEVIIPNEKEEVSSQKDPTKVYGKVDNFKGLTYNEIVEGISPNGYKYTDKWNFKIVRKEYTEDYEQDKICGQNPKANEEVPIGTTIELTISLGPDDNTLIPSVIGMEEKDAIIELLRAGFKYENISVEKRLTGNAASGTVIEVNPAVGIRESIENKITLYIEQESQLEYTE